MLWSIDVEAKAGAARKLELEEFDKLDVRLVKSRDYRDKKDETLPKETRWKLSIAGLRIE
jgi:hypothetical protein